MDQIETNTHAFVIRIWRERADARGETFIWRGHITHVPSGKRTYLRSLDDIANVMLPYLEQLGVKLSMRLRVQQWLSRYRL